MVVYVCVFFSSRRRHTRCALVTGVQTCALPIFVDQVDGLVRQEPVGDVAVCQRRGRDQRLIGDGHPVVRLIAVAQALEHLDGVRDRGLVDLDRLETTLEGGVLLEVLAVFVERGGTDGL